MSMALRQLFAGAARLHVRLPTFFALAPAVVPPPVLLPMSVACSLRGYIGKRWLVPFDHNGDSSLRLSLLWGFGDALEEPSAIPSLLMRAPEEPQLSERRSDRPGSPPQVSSTASLLASAAGDEPEVRLTPESFCVTVDVHQFEPGEVQVKVRDDALLIAARRGPRTDGHGSSDAGELLREFTIPGEVDQQTLACRLTPIDGSLRVEAKLKPQLQHEAAKSEERVLEVKTDPKTPEREGAGPNSA